MSVAVLPALVAADIAAADKEVQELKARLATTTKPKEAVEDAIVEALQSTTTQTKLQKAIDDIAGAATFIHKTFKRVTSVLESIDQTAKESLGSAAPAELAPKWKDLHKRFRDLVWHSKDLADATAAHIADLKDTHIYMIELKLGDLTSSTMSPTERMQKFEDEVRGELQKFIAKQNPATKRSPSTGSALSKTAAQAESQAFVELKEDIESFHQKLSSYGEASKKELNRNLADLDKMIESLVAQIEGYNKNIKELNNAIEITGAVTSSGVLGCLSLTGPFGPILAGVVLVAGGIVLAQKVDALNKVMSNKDDAEKQLAEAREQRVVVIEQTNTVEVLQSNLKGQSDNITGICSQLDKFENLWAVVASDAAEMDLLVANAVQSGNSDYLKRRLALLKLCYDPLHQGLKDYARSVSTSEVPKN